MSQVCSRMGVLGPLLACKMPSMPGRGRQGRALPASEVSKWPITKGWVTPPNPAPMAPLSSHSCLVPPSLPGAGAAPWGRRKGAVYLSAMGGEAEDKLGVPCPWSVSRIWHRSENPRHVPATGVGAGGCGCLGAPRRRQLRTPAPCPRPPSCLRPAAWRLGELGAPPLAHSLGTAGKWPCCCLLGGHPAAQEVVPCPVAALPGSRRSPLQG